MNFLLRIYKDETSFSPEVTIEIDASTEITADKIALNIVEKEYPGFDWSLTKI